MINRSRPPDSPEKAKLHKPIVDEEAVYEAHRLVRAAPSARCYAHRRYVQSCSEADRQVWLARKRESDLAAALQ